MKGKSFALALSATLAFSTGIHTVYAESYDSKINKLQDEQTTKEKARESKELELEEIKREQKTAEDEIFKIDQTLTDTNKKMDNKKTEIDEANKKIKQLKKEISELEKRIAERDELLKNRVRSMQLNGGVNYLDVLLGAQSFSDFISRASALNTIAEQDRQILDEHKEDMLALEEAQAKLDEELAFLESKLAELNALKAQLDQQMKEKQQVLKSLKAKEGEIEDYIVSIEEEQAILQAREAALVKEKQAAERRARERAQEPKKVATASTGRDSGNSRNEVPKEKQAIEHRTGERAPIPEKAATTSANGDSRNTGNEVSSSRPPVSSGAFMRPTTGVITDRFGTRGGSHYGVDIAQNGLVPIVAAADGTVSKAYSSSSYGNVVFIVHYINGQMYESVYAHQRYYTVSAGQSVKKGEIIGYQGNTGNSFGQHLHFELHKGGWNGSKSNAVNPLNYF